MMNATDQIEKLYNERGKRAKQLHDAGQKVIGYFCCFVPDEIITALDMIPYRIQGITERAHRRGGCAFRTDGLSLCPQLLQHGAQRGI